LLLRKQPCKWRYCNVVMNTVDKLSHHVAQHVRNMPGPYICLWHNCTRKFSEGGKALAHLKSHVRIPVPCPYQDCDLGYRSSRDLVAHCQQEHGIDRHRPSPTPFKPILIDMPPVPLQMPSYMVVPRDIRQTPVSKERHALLGPWVLRNIFGPVTLEPKQQNAAVPLRNVRRITDKDDPNQQTIANDEYEFLRPKSPSSIPKARFDDLPSMAVSRLVHGGLVFWGPNVDVKEEPDPPDTPEHLDASPGDPADIDDDKGYEYSSSQGEASTEPLELSSAPDAEIDDRIVVEDLPTGSDDTSRVDIEAPAKDAGCLVV